MQVRREDSAGAHALLCDTLCARIHELLGAAHDQAAASVVLYAVPYTRSYRLSPVLTLHNVRYYSGHLATQLSSMACRPHIADAMAHFWASLRDIAMRTVEVCAESL